jgi:hypothetical protein
MHQFVTGKGSEIGDYLTQHRDAHAVSFTGGGTGLLLLLRACLLVQKCLLTSTKVLAKKKKSLKNLLTSTTKKMPLRTCLLVQKYLLNSTKVTTHNLLLIQYLIYY